MTLLDFIRLVRKNALILLLGAVLGGGLAAAWTFTRPSVYRAQAVGLVVAGDSMSVANAAQSDMTANARASVYANLITTRAVAVRVNELMKAQGLAPGTYTASVRGGTSFIQVSSSAPSSRAAQATADAALQALTAEALRMETYSVAQQQGVPQKDLGKLTSIHILPYEQALAPAAPERPNLVRNIALGVAAGLGLALAFALLRRQLDVKLRTKGEVEKLTGRSVLGVIPASKDLKRAKGRGISALPTSGHAGEAMRKLRTNLRFVNVDQPVRSVVVTSANPGEGKSTIASNLARLVALSGQRTILVDCDLRRPMQATIFGLDSSVGLSQVLAGDLAAADALVSTDVPGLELLAAGRIPPNPSELVGSQRMAALIDELSQDAFVILDAPPMLAVTDAALLAAASDGALFVAVAGRTPKEQIRLCAEQFIMVDAALLGTVLNRATRATYAESTYGYSYGRYGYRSKKYYSDVELNASAPLPVPDAADASAVSVTAPAEDPKAVSARRARN